MTKLILDCDTGIDDTLALLYALADPKCELLGVVGIFGNVTEAQATQNNRDVLDFCGHSDTPVYHGLEKPSFYGKNDPFIVDEGCKRFHGENGFGGAKLHLDDSHSRGEIYDDGAQFIIDSVRQYGSDVTIVATGPMTDVDEALRRAPEIAEQMRIVIMGGTLTQPGNCYDLISETNIWNDPEAANRLFHSGANITMVGLDVTHRTLMTREHARSFKNLGTPLGAFLYSMVRYYINANEASDPIFLEGSPLHDPLAVAVALDPSLVETFPINLQVDLGGQSRGRTIGDAARLRKPAVSTRVALGVDSQRFLNRWFEHITSIASEY